jgi:hypothetical protein
MLPMMPSSALPKTGMGKAPSAGGGRGRGRLGDGVLVVVMLCQSAPVSVIAVRAAFSSTVGLLWAKAAMREPIARLLIGKLFHYTARKARNLIES